MRKYLIMLFVLVTLCFFADTSNGSNNPYVGAGIGLALVNDISGSSPGRTWINTLNAGVVFDLAAGYQFSSFRVELLGLYQFNTYDQVWDQARGFVDATGDLINFSLFLSGYYDLLSSADIVPFVGGGLGFNSIDVKDLRGEGWASGANSDDTVFAFHVGAGVGYKLKTNVILDVRYRYLNTTDPEFDGDVHYEFASHHVLLTLRIGL